MTPLTVGWFLAVREVRRASKWTTLLIIFVMMLTFLNLVVIGGILVGLIEGSVKANRDRYSGDVIISTLRSKSYIEGSAGIISLARALPDVQTVVYRYGASGTIEADYKTKLRQTDIPNRAGGTIAGIDPVAEDAMTNLSDYLVEGTYLSADDTDAILVGANLLYKYTPIEASGFTTLRNVGAGSTVRLTTNGVSREVLIKGVLKTKAGEVDQRIFMPERQLRQLIGRGDLNVDEIVIRIKPGASAIAVQQQLLASGVGDVARVQTAEEALPKFLNDIKATFALLGNLIGAIGLAVASITIFIVIFVNAITRRKYIGIMKGIGINARAIEIAYVMQALFYAFIGTGIGVLVLYGVLKPYFDAYPINFPFSDGILVATIPGTIIRMLILYVATIIAGYIPAKIVIRQNTLDAILGR